MGFEKSKPINLWIYVIHIDKSELQNLISLWDLLIYIIIMNNSATNKNIYF